MTTRDCRGPDAASRERWPDWLPPFYAAMAAVAMALALAWWVFNTWHDPGFILTSFHGHAPLAPIYGFFLPRSSYGIWLALLVLALGPAGWSLLPWNSFRPWRREILFLCFAFVFAAAFRLALHAVRAPELPGREFLTYPGEDVLFDVPRIDSPGDFLRDYTALQPRLSLHGRTKPPGFALMHYAIFRLLGDDVRRIGTLLTILASLIVLPCYALGLLLRGRAADGRACAMLAAVVPSAAQYGAVSLDAVFAVLAGAALVIALLELKRPGWRARLALGLILSLGMMLSYSTLLVGFFCACLIVLDRMSRPAACASHLFQVLLFFLLPLAALYLYPGFDAWECFTNAREINAALMRGVVGHPLAGPAVWSYCSAGNLLAFLIGVGLPITAGWCLLPWHAFERVEAIVAGAFALTLAAACFGGIYLMETERILLYLLPGAILAAVLPARFRALPAVALAGLQAIAMELLVFTLW